MEDNLMHDIITMEHSYSVLSGSTCPNGKTVKGWEHFDQIISKFMVEQKIPGASVAVSKKGNILYQQGYGVAGAGCRVHQDSMFRIASISKPLTAAIAVQLLDKLKIPLNTTVFGKTGILKSYRTRDKRMKNITVQHLLQHSAGWDRDKVGDAVFVRPQCVVKEHPDLQAYNSALLAYALRRKLQFSPGTWHSYSNLGYLVLGEVIEALSGQPYHRVLQTFLQDLHIHGIIVGQRRRTHHKCMEVEYFNNREPQVVNSLYPEEGVVLPQYGGMAMESSASYGGLVADAASLLRFIHCMEEAVNQSNIDDSRVQSKSTVKDALSTKIGAEPPGPEFVGRDDLHCQPIQQLKMNAVESKNFHGSEQVNKDSCYNLCHANKADLIGVSSNIFQTSSDSTVSDRHSDCLNKSDASFVLSDNLVEEPVYKQMFSPRRDVYDIEHGLVKNTSDLYFNKTNTDLVENISQSDMFGESNSAVTPQMKMQYQCDTFLHQNVCLCGKQCDASDVICQLGQQYDSSDRQCSSSGICPASKNYDSSDKQCNSSGVCQPIQQQDSSDRQCNSSGICKTSQKNESRDRQCNSSDVVCQFSQNFGSRDMHNFRVVGCEPGQNFDSNNWQYNSSAVVCQSDQDFNSSDMQYNSSAVVCQSDQDFNSSDMQYNSSAVVCQSDQDFNSSDMQYNSSAVVCQSDQDFNSSDWQYNSSAFVCQSDQDFNSSYMQYNSSTASCEPSQNWDSNDWQYKSSDVGSESGQNFDSSDLQYNSKTVGCEPRQNFDSSDWQNNSSPDICQSNQTSEMYVDNKCDTCSLKITARKCSTPECNSNRHVNNLKPMHLFNCTCNNRLAKPLLTGKLATESLSRPDFENGRDWYGLGWDVQDDGKSWGHTGGMDGSCGTLFHHHSGLNWTFLLNSWAVDADLNGVMKCALCSVSDAGMYDQDILSVDSEFGVRIVTRDKLQIICLSVSESTLSKVISQVKTDGFVITWISTISQDFSYVATKLSQSKKINQPHQQNYGKPGKSEPHNRYIAVFKRYHVMDYFVIFNKTAIELQSIINECKKDNFVINFVDSFVDSEAQLKFTAVFKYDKSISHDDDIIVLLAMAANDYVKHVKRFLQSHYVVVQSVTEVCANLYVSAILSARNSQDNSYVDKPVKNTNSVMNKPVKATNVLPARNAESAEVYLEMIVQRGRVSKTLHRNTNNDGSSSLSDLQRSEDTVFHESGGETVFHEAGGETVFHESGGATVFHEAGGETVFQESGGETVFHEAGGETVFHEAGGETVFHESGGETVFHEAEGATVFNQSAGETVNQESYTHRSSETVQTATSNELSARSRARKQTKRQSMTSNKSKRQTSSLSNSSHWVQITPESFLTELNRQTKQSNTLVYARFYNVDRKPYVSGCWRAKGGRNCYQRVSMSRYGLVPELVEAASENVYLQCLSEYVEEDGAVYYAAIWQAS